MESMHDGGDLQGFWNSRRGGIQEVADPEAKRVQRLEQELKALREALTMQQVQGQDPLGAYGAQPFQRIGPPTANPGRTSGTSTRHVRTSTCGIGSILDPPILKKNPRWSCTSKKTLYPQENPPTLKKTPRSKVQEVDKSVT